MQSLMSKNTQVFTTCGSETKRDFLLETFPGLKPQNIGDSRCCAFEATVMKGTNGRGVDLCLNSLDRDKLQVVSRSPVAGSRIMSWPCCMRI